MTKIEKLREEVDKTNARILQNLIDRFQLVKEIAETKQNLDTEIYDPEREHKMLSLLDDKLQESPEKTYIMKCFEDIIKNSREYCQSNYSK